MNNRGIFITLTAFFLGAMLIASFSNVQKIILSDNEASNVAIAGEQSAFARNSALDAVKSIYSMDANITYQSLDGNFVYTETFPSVTGKTKFSQSLNILKNFVAQEYPGIVSINSNAAGVDLGRIRVYGKDINVLHSLTNGFGNNRDIYFSKSSTNFNTLILDINEVANANNVTSSLPACGGCASPVRLIVTWRDNSGVQFTNDSLIDFLQPGSVDVRSSGNRHVIFSYTSAGWQISTDSPTVSLYAKTVFNDSVFEVGPDRELVSVTQTPGYGFTS